METNNKINYKSLSLDELATLSPYINCNDLFDLLQNPNIKGIKYKTLINKIQEPLYLTIGLELENIDEPFFLCVLYPEDTFAYLVNLDGTATICDGFTFHSKFIIPNEIKRHKITAIDNYSFCHQHNNLLGVEEILVENGIKELGINCFFNCKFHTITLPNSVTRIGANAFSDCDYLQQMVIPNKVQHIEEGTFENCYRLNRVYIPKSVTRIDDDAFYNCTNLREIYYEGTVEEWKNIDISDSNKEFLNRCYISCDDGSSVYFRDGQFIAVPNNRSMKRNYKAAMQKIEETYYTNTYK